jgi:hypothetical protein
MMSVGFLLALHVREKILKSFALFLHAEKEKLPLTGVEDAKRICLEPGGETVPRHMISVTPPWLPPSLRATHHLGLLRESLAG